MTGMQYYPLTGFFLWNCPKPRMNEHFKKKRMKFILYMVSFLNFLLPQALKRNDQKMMIGNKQVPNPQSQHRTRDVMKNFPQEVINMIIPDERFFTLY